MALPIPDDFDVQTQILDSNETFIRDELKLDIENWARFRYAIHVGNEADNLHSIHPIGKDVKEAYRELAKSHYETVNSLGYARLALGDASQSHQINLLPFCKSLKDFYFHVGCLLDNLARLIYIVNDPGSASETNSKGRLVRHWVH
jgi:hypothetical protein